MAAEAAVHSEEGPVLGKARMSGTVVARRTVDSLLEVDVMVHLQAFGRRNDSLGGMALQAAVVVDFLAERAVYINGLLIGIGVMTVDFDRKVRFLFEKAQGAGVMADTAINLCVQRLFLPGLNSR
ncbi:MAG: hypothetical protein AUK32_08255 [Candidatus Aquicultor secundus]|nr:MAG: hypothetical protein AUK32_08255 [Candidatus Aquicultor secundus]